MLSASANAILKTSINNKLYIQLTITSSSPQPPRRRRGHLKQLKQLHIKLLPKVQDLRPPPTHLPRQNLGNQHRLILPLPHRQILSLRIISNITLQLIQASYDKFLQFLTENGEDVVAGDFVEVGEEGLEGVEGERDVEGDSTVEEFLGLEVEFVGGEEFGELVGVEGEAEVAQAGFAGLGHNNILLIE